MSEYESDYTVQRFTIDEPIHLPADSPDECPHIIDVERAREMIGDYEPEGLNAVDAIATVLYKWNPDALKDMLNMSKRGFHWKFYSLHDYEWYVIRRGRNVKMGNKGLSEPYPDFEIRYTIRSNGAWRIIGGSEYLPPHHRTFHTFRDEDKQSASEYDNMFASRVIIEEMWKVENSKKIICGGKVYRDPESKKRKRKTSRVAAKSKTFKNESSGAEKKSKKRKIEASEAEKK